MALNITRALCGRTNINVSMLRSPTLYGIRSVSIKVVKPEAESTLSYDEKNEQMKRELSPHLTIYKPQLTSMLSITHRFTGMALTGYAAVLGFGALVLPHDFSFYMTMIEGLQLSASTLAVIKFYIAFPATFHTCNGIRHLLWDNGKFLNLNEVYTTGYIMIGVSIVLAGILAAL